MGFKIALAIGGVVAASAVTFAGCGSGGDKGAMSLDEFVDKLLKEVDDKSLELTM